MRSEALRIARAFAFPAVLVMLALLAGMTGIGAVPAGASQATDCPPQTPILTNLSTPVGEPVDAVVAKVGCLPLDETLSEVVIDWGDGQTTAGTAAFEVEAGGTSKTALIRGRHVYARATCQAGTVCPDGYLPKATVVTDSDGARRVGGGFMIQVFVPAPVGGGPAPVGRARFRSASVKAKRAPPVVRRRGKRVIVNPRMLAICPRQEVGPSRCTVRARLMSRGRALATRRIGVEGGSRVMPRLALRGRWKRAFLAGGRIRAKIIVSVDQRHEGVDPATGSRTTILRLR